MLKDLLHEKVISPALMADDRFLTAAKIISIDETNNRCNVFYKDKYNKLKNGEDFYVDLRNADNWFPSVGEIVLVDATYEPGTILHKYTDNYAIDVRGPKKLVKDTTFDSECSVYGGSIL